MWLQANSDVSIPVSLSLNGQLIIPDEGSLKLTLRDNTGAVLPGFDRLSQPDPLSISSEIVLTILAAQNTLAVDSDFETRYATLEFTYQEIPGFNKFSYNLAPFIPLTVEPEDVRRVLGLEAEELPDEDIELIGSYFQLKSDFGDNFTEALTATGISKLHANEAVVIREALRVFPSLQNRVLSIEKTDAYEYTRAKGDLSKLKAQLETRLSGLLTLIAKDQASTPILFMVSNPTDPVTNA